MAYDNQFNGILKTDVYYAVTLAQDLHNSPSHTPKVRVKRELCSQPVPLAFVWDNQLPLPQATSLKWVKG